MKVLSVVCARAGSKGLKNKCMAKINDKMVVEYAVDYSLSLGEEVKTVVSTNIEELIEYCRKNNINCIDRDPNICADDSRIDDALANAIEEYGSDCKYCSIVYGNIPVRYPELFQEALSFLEDNEDFDAVVGMHNVEKFHPDWMFDLNSEVLPKVKESHYRRQMLDQKMIHDGHTFLFKSEPFYKKYKGEIIYDVGYRYSIFGAKIKPLLNDKLTIDIDTEKDLIISKAVLLTADEQKGNK